MENGENDKTQGQGNPSEIGRQASTHLDQLQKYIDHLCVHVETTTIWEENFR